MAKLKTVQFGAQSSDIKKADGTIIIPVAEGKGKKPALTVIGRQADAASKGQLTRAMEVEQFTGGSGKTLTITAPHGMKADRVVLLGTGDKLPKDVGTIERLGGDAAGAVIGFNAAQLHLIADGNFDAVALRHFVLGMDLRHYAWSKATDEKTKAGLAAATDLSVILAGRAGAKTVASLQTAYTTEAGIIVPSVHLARTLVNQRADELNTADLEAAAVNAAKGAGLKVTVLNHADLTSRKMGAILAVGQGSPNQPRVVVIEYNGNPASKKKTALIGKGLVYDTGGLSLKPTEGMIDMNIDMGGAAAALSAMLIAAKQGVKANLVAVLGIAENVIGSKSYRPGDILTSMSGKTIEVDNTDAEGRLVLADCMTLAQKELGATTLIEASTLTGASMIALGIMSYTGAMTEDEKLWVAVDQAAKNSGDPAWRLPMNSDISAMLKAPSGQADMSNIGAPARMAGASVGAHFLQRFVEKGSQFVHLDIASMAWASKPGGVYSQGGTGAGARLMAETVRVLSRGR